MSGRLDPREALSTGGQMPVQRDLPGGSRHGQGGGVPAVQNVRPFRFGTNGGYTESSRLGWADHARRVEDLGFSTLLMPDHFLVGTMCTPRLAAAAMVTTTLRLGSYVYDNDFRNPLLLAREAAEIDVLSGGRMELGIGAGWAKDEYDMVGMAFDPGPTRAARYEEAVGLIRRLLNGETVTHEGAFYRLEDCELGIEPIQHPIPLLLGGGGTRMTRFAAEQADSIGFLPRSMPGGGLDPAEFSLAAFTEKVTVLEDAVGRSGHAGPERGALLFFVGRNAEEIPPAASGWTDPEILRHSPYALIGETHQMIESLLERRERWGLS